MRIPSAISAERYRCFYERANLELRPLTLLYGRNNVGKSALLRLLPLLSASVEDRPTAPLDLSHAAARGGSMPGLIWRGPVPEDPEPGMEVAIEWPSPATVRRVEHRIDFSREHGAGFVRRLRVWGAGDSEPALDASWVPTREEDPTRLRYEVRGDSNIVEIAFAGLRPLSASMSLPLLEEAAEQLAELRGAVQWIQALRSAPPRLLPIRGGANRILQPDGSDALHLLYSNKELHADVSRWYEQALGHGLELTLTASASEFRPLLAPIARTQMKIELADAGEGMAQVLPLIVALAHSRRGGSSTPKLVAFEEPESHLHPDAQRALAELVLHTVAIDEPPCVVLETHSHAMLLAVQLGIARNPALAERVVAYWVHQLDDGRARMERITFSDRGQPRGNWPPNAFSDQRELARQLVQLQLDRVR